MRVEGRAMRAQAGWLVVVKGQRALMTLRNDIPFAPLPILQSVPIHTDLFYCRKYIHSRRIA
ncbi:hypothetical protein CFR76_03275 [Komagataeibacter swingsii]|uniref:Uncharacterized protein n=1 Tax=Komagataeibacter swingsii TaxID=215220 RepID=A0A2V4R7Y7_9PROT|nr:hypothetical protein CFR76_03275 [Komagataeibacter swingsii]